MVFLDQILFAFFNFCTIFLLSKTTGVKDFSSFVLFQSSIFFIYVFCTFFLSSPILVLNTKRWKKTGSYYLITLITTNFFINFFLSIGIYFFLLRQEVYVPFIYVISIPFLMSLYDIFKKYLLSVLKINLLHCVISTFLLNVTFFVGIFIFLNELKLNLILFLYLLSYAIANLYLLAVVLLERNKLFYSGNINTTKDSLFLLILKNHFVYSKWIILGGFAFWGYNQGIFIFSKLLGAEDVAIAKIRTIQNLLGVTNILLVTVENLYTPIFSNFILKNSISELHKLVKKLYFNNYIKIILIALLAFLFAMIVYYFLYQEKYGNGLWIIVFFTLTQTVLLTIRPLIISLKSIEVTRPFFYGHLLAVCVMLIAGYFFIVNYQYNGMAVVFVLSNLAFSAIVIYFYKAKFLHTQS